VIGIFRLNAAPSNAHGAHGGFCFDGKCKHVTYGCYYCGLKASLFTIMSTHNYMMPLYVYLSWHLSSASFSSFHLTHFFLQLQKQNRVCGKWWKMFALSDEAKEGEAAGGDSVR
jgi:hypothetical protein